MTARLSALLAVLSLAGCIDASFGSSHNVEVRFHRALPAAGATLVMVTNVSGAIVLDGWDKPTVDVSALEYGSDQSAIDRTHVSVQRDGSAIVVKTDYDSSGFFGRGGAQVDYAIHIPKAASVSVTNVSGPTTVNGLNGNVEAEVISGRLAASLGRLAGTRNVHISAISGSVIIRIARSSDARVDASTISGSVNLFFPTNTHQGAVGNSATGQIGKGAASMTLHTISGSIAVLPE